MFSQVLTGIVAIVLQPPPQEDPAGGASASAASPGEAAEGYFENALCSDILNDPSIRTEVVRSNKAMKLVAYNRLMRLPFATATTDQASGFGIPVANYVLPGGPIDQARYNHRIAWLNADFSYTIPEKRETDAALTSMNPQIISLWRQCASAREALTIRFEVENARNVSAVVEYFGNGDARITEDTNLPAGITAVAGMNCLRAGRVHRRGEPCPVTLNVDNPTRDLLLGATSTWGTALGYLPPRVRLVRETRSLPIRQCTGSWQTPACRHHIHWRSENHIDRKSWTLRIPADLPTDMRDQGWEFLAGTGAIQIVVLERYSPSNTSWCDTPQVAVQPTAFTYRYRLRTGREQGQNSVLVCYVIPRINVYRERWQPDL